jgi:hypothetical protein
MENSCLADVVNAVSRANSLVQASPCQLQFVRGASQILLEKRIVL